MTEEVMQSKLRILSPANQQRLMKEQQNQLSKELFSGEMHTDMPKYRQFVFVHVSESVMNISLNYWKYMFHGGNFTYTLADIVTFVTAAAPRTFREWLNYVPYVSGEIDKAITDWVAFKGFVLVLEEAVNPLIDDIFNKLYQKIMSVQHLDTSGQSKSIPMSHRK